MTSKPAEQDIQLVETPTPQLTEEAEGTGGGPPAARVRKFLLHIPILSIIVGATLFLAEVTLIALVLGSPETLGIAGEDALELIQRYVLGGVTIVMLIEAFLLGTIDTGVNRRKARLFKTQRRLIEQNLQRLKESGNLVADQTSNLSTVLSPDQVASLLINPLDTSQDVGQWASKTAMESMGVTELRKELNKHTLQYVAALLFELASFLWKWALTLLVISNNWISVGVAIAGGIVYPVVVFWQKSIKPKQD